MKVCRTEIIIAKRKRQDIFSQKGRLYGRRAIVGNTIKQTTTTTKNLKKGKGR